MFVLATPAHSLSRQTNLFVDTLPYHTSFDAMMMMMMIKTFVSLLLVLPSGVSAFVPTPRRILPPRGGSFSTRPSWSSSSSALWYDSRDDNDNVPPPRRAWSVTNDFSTFLNQITCQSFLFVLGSLRDPHTVRWVDTFTQPVFPDDKQKSARVTGTTQATTDITSNERVSHPNGKSSTRLLIFHGIGCWNTTAFPTWNSYFEQLLARPSESYIIQSHNGLSRDYDMEINPASLCARILSVREQIAKELAHDLGIVARSMGTHTMESYWEYLDKMQEEEPDEEELGTATPQPSPIDHNMITMSSGADVKRRLPPHNLVFLDYSLAGSGDMAPSPLRKGNFDLVVLLATQESICRILNDPQRLLQDLKSHPQRKVYQQFLKEFYTERLESHFTGIQRYGRADDFLEELLFSTGGLVDPVRLTEMILREREQVALEWQARSQDVPNDHITIKRLQLDRLLESYN